MNKDLMHFILKTTKKATRRSLQILYEGLRLQVHNFFFWLFTAIIKNSKKSITASINSC